jgi:hypothetical protein
MSDEKSNRRLIDLPLKDPWELEEGETAFPINLIVGEQTDRDKILTLKDIETLAKRRMSSIQGLVHALLLDEYERQETLVAKFGEPREQDQVAMTLKEIIELYPDYLEDIASMPFRRPNH